MAEFRSVKPEELKENPFELIGKDWLLITAEKNGTVNSMTASWGAMGILWGKPVAIVFIRPQRYTKEFVDSNEMFTISFLPEEYRKALNLCGSFSGREVGDKWELSGLHPHYVDKTTAVEEADLVFVCRKLYAQEMKSECFIDTTCDAVCYPDKDYHIMYIAEIVKVLKKED